MFDIRQLRYAIAAADHGSFYRAARALDVDQSTLSRAVMKLECSIGMPIFERSRGGVTMTLAGDAFIRGAKPMVITADKLLAMMREAGQGRAGGFMLGHNSSGLVTVLCRSPISLCHLGFEGERADAAQI